MAKWVDAMSRRSHWNIYEKGKSGGLILRIKDAIPGVENGATPAS
jgi:hypothetical protein